MRARVALVVALAVAAVGAPAALAAARAPQWWAWIATEQTPMTWLQSVTLVLGAAASLLLAHLAARTSGPRTMLRAYLLMAAGFAALALDERFAVHERLRDGILAPRGISLPFLPWVAPGDFLMICVGLVGLAALPLVWRAMSPDRWASASLVVGVVLAIVAVGMDSVDPATMSLATERLEQTLEECVELASGLALLGAVGLRLLGAIDAVLGATTPPVQRVS